MSDSPLKRRLLFIKVTIDYPERQIANIQAICEQLGVQFCLYNFFNLSELCREIEGTSQFDYVYLAAHGDHAVFCEKGSIPIRWADFGVALCMAGIMKEGSTLFLGCCHGGLKKVALTLFHNCPSIVSVCGPKGLTSTHHVTVALHVFLYNLIVRNEERDCAAERASKATGYSFPLYDRFDLEAELTSIRAHEEYAHPDFMAYPEALYPDSIQSGDYDDDR